MRTVQKEEHRIRSLPIINDLVRMILQDAGLDHEGATLVVYAVHPDWRLNMSQGVQVGTRQITQFEIELKAVAEGEDPVGAGLTVLRDGRTMSALELRETLLKSPNVSGQRFMYDRGEVKAFQRSRTGVVGRFTPSAQPNPRPVQLLAEPPPDQGVESASAPPPPIPSVAHNGASKSPEGRGPLLVGENPEDLQLVLMALATSDRCISLFGSDVFHNVIDSNTGIAHTNIEIMHMLRTLLHRGYLEKVGSSPSKYRLNPEKVTEGADGKSLEKKKPARSRLGSGFVGAEEEIARLEKALAGEVSLKEQLATIQVVIKARRDALASARQITADKTQCETLIGNLERQLAEANVRLGHLQGQHRLVEDGPKPLEQAQQAEAELQSKLAQFVGTRERLTKLRTTLATLSELMGA